MERSIEWRTCSIWHKFHSFMLSSPKFKMVTQISLWIAWNWWFLLKTLKWNMHFHWKVSNRKTGSPFKKFTHSWKSFSGTHGKCVFHQHPNPNFLVNDKRPSILWCPYYMYLRAWHRPWPTLLLQFQYTAHILCTPLPVHANYNNNNNNNQKSPTVYIL